ncbi:MAG: beta-methylgalactoside transporter [Candidatus Limiplasma sp.]|nr:beta-methylgalactoside transporter [Candidatus Limiplasma sp.]
MSQQKQGKLQKRIQDFHALSRGDQFREVGNWLLDHAMIIIIVLLCVYIQIQRPAFLQIASIVNIIQLTASRLPIALGIAGAIILTGTDLSAGRIVGLSGFVAAIMLQKVGIANKFLTAIGPQSIWLVIPVVLALGALIGIVNGFCVAKFKLHPFIVTLSTQLLTYGAYLTLSNAVQISNLDESYTTGFVMKAMFKLGNTPVMSYVGYAIIVTIIMWFIWNKTTFGKNMFAVGSNEEAARVSGVNVTMTIIGVFALAGATYGYTGFVEAARLGASTGTVGLNYELDAIAACVIGGVSFVGGIGKISGVIMGVILMQLIISGMTFLGISGNTTYIIKGLVILIACAIDMRKYLTKK